MRRILLPFLMLVFMVITVNGQYVKKEHPFSRTLMLGVDLGVTAGILDYSDLTPDFMGRISAQYNFPTTAAGILGLKAFAAGGWISGGYETSRFNWSADGRTRNPDITEVRAVFLEAGGGPVYTFKVTDSFFPYIFVGASANWFSPRDTDGNNLPKGENNQLTWEDLEVNYHFELGSRFALAENMTFNVAIGAKVSPNDYWDAIKSEKSDMSINALVGVSFNLFGTRDSDGDGVSDDVDKCPGTPFGVKVDAFGCPLDTDNDGVPDHLDRCANTPIGVKVDSEGCAVDSDGDSVPDHKDKCPNTPAGALVNEEGCPDTDNDGVPDNLDKCPSTPEGAPVNPDGCPKDSDGDGVYDYLDKCPNTPIGTRVDEFGCERVVERKEIRLEGDTNFESGKADLIVSAYNELTKIAKDMNEFPETRWYIEGHTDSRGSASSNLDLSRRRAQSVIDYLVSQGVERDRLVLVAKGEDEPIADNNSAEGRAMNRRVEIKLIEDE